MKTIKAKYDSKKEWKQDPKGYFLIRIKDNQIEAAHVKNDHSNNPRHYPNKAEVIIGETAEEIYNTIIRENLVSLQEHAAYLGSELQKAEIAMKNKLKYVQDEELNL
jgi:dihydropteroate synthase